MQTPAYRQFVACSGAVGVGVGGCLEVYPPGAWATGGPPSPAEAGFRRRHLLRLCLPPTTRRRRGGWSQGGPLSRFRVPAWGDTPTPHTALRQEDLPEPAILCAVSWITPHGALLRRAAPPILHK